MNPIKISGPVIEGKKLGRTLGFPTANILYNDDIETGIYAAWAQIEQDPSWYKAAVHLGPRPAINDHDQSLEAHLLDFSDKTLYGEHITLYLMEKIREVENFENLDALREAIAKDCLTAQSVLNHPPA